MEVIFTLKPELLLILFYKFSNIFTLSTDLERYATTFFPYFLLYIRQ